MQYLLLVASKLPQGTAAGGDDRPFQSLEGAAKVKGEAVGEDLGERLEWQGSHGNTKQVGSVSKVVPFDGTQGVLERLKLAVGSPDVEWGRA